MTTAGVVAVGVLEAIVFAVGLSIVDVVRRSARPHDAVLGWVERLGRWADVAVHRSARVVPGVVVYRLDDRLFFANQSYCQGGACARRSAAHPSEPRTISCSTPRGSRTSTAPGSTPLGDLCEGLARDGVTLRVARMKTPVHDRLEDAGVADRIGRERFHPTVRAAVRASVRVST